jgi:3,4-dihydroxy-2-butanone 4-phosphate synthase
MPTATSLSGSGRGDLPFGVTSIAPTRFDATEAMQIGKVVIVVDEQSYGNFVFAAALASPALVGWTVRHSSGFVEVAVPNDYLVRLDIPEMAFSGPRVAPRCGASHCRRRGWIDRNLGDG